MYHTEGVLLTQNGEEVLSCGKSHSFLRMTFPRWNLTLKEKCVVHADAEVCDFLIAFMDGNYSVRKVAADG